MRCNPVKHTEVAREKDCSGHQSKMWSACKDEGLNRPFAFSFAVWNDFVLFFYYLMISLCVCVCFVRKLAECKLLVTTVTERREKTSSRFLLHKIVWDPDNQLWLSWDGLCIFCIIIWLAIVSFKVCFVFLYFPPLFPFMPKFLKTKKSEKKKKAVWVVAINKTIYLLTPTFFHFGQCTTWSYYTRWLLFTDNSYISEHDQHLLMIQQSDSRSLCQ